jgi:DNA-binding CsgD family transcriptional regulator
MFGQRKADDMSIARLANSRASHSDSTFGARHSAHVTSFLSGPAKIQLRESLAREAALLRRVDALIQEQQKGLSKLVAWREDAMHRIASLTPREREIMALILAGHSNKAVAAGLGLSRRTVENHRAEIMKRTGAKSLPALARLALAAAWNGAPEPNP